MNTRPNTGGPTPGDGQSALSLLVNAADSRDASQSQRDAAAGGFQGQSLADTLRLRGFTSSEPTGTSLEEQLFLQQQHQQQHRQQFLGAPSSALLSQLRDHNILSQLGGAGPPNPSQNQHLASLLGLSAGTVPAAPGPVDIRSALAAAQLRQQPHQPQLSHADILALSRTGAFSGATSSFLGGVAPPAPTMNGLGPPVPAPGGLASELESLQRLEEIERRQRLMATGTAPPTMLPPGAAAVAASREASNTVRGPVIRDERIPGGHIPRPATMDTSQNSKKDPLPSEEVCTVIPPIEANTKEELEKTPGSVIVPCRARGMPMDHNFKVITKRQVVDLLFIGYELTSSLLLRIDCIFCYSGECETR